MPLLFVVALLACAGSAATHAKIIYVDDDAPAPGGSWLQDDVTSPCIDAGDLNSPVGDEPFPKGGIVNMGAYGGTAEASMSPIQRHTVGQ